MRKADLYLLFWAVLLGLVLLMFIHAGAARRRLEPESQLKKRYVEELGLADICLFTEARYTRHPAVADRHAAFQDHPASLEHFPSGSLLGPPQHLGRPSERTKGQ